MKVDNCVFVFISGLSVYFAAPIYFGDWYLSEQIVLLYFDKNIMEVDR